MKDSGDVEGAGVLIRQFDKNNALEQPWMPCPREGPDSWCGKFADRWSALMLNALTPHLYDNNGGVVLAPTAKLFCAYPEDGDSSHESKVCYDVWPPPPSPPDLRARAPPPPRHHTVGRELTSELASPPDANASATEAAARARRLSWTRTGADAKVTEDAEVKKRSAAAKALLGATAADTRHDGCIPYARRCASPEPCLRSNRTRQLKHATRHQQHAARYPTPTLPFASETPHRRPHVRSHACVLSSGCNRKGMQCRDVGRAHDAYLCSFPPEQLEYALKAQLLRESFQVRNNEMVVDLSSVAPNLPLAIEAFFIVAGAPDYKIDYAVNAYRAFKAYYVRRSGRGRTLINNPITLDPCALCAIVLVLMC